MKIKELSVPLAKMDELKTSYRMIATDERNTAVLKPTATFKQRKMEWEFGRGARI